MPSRRKPGEKVMKRTETINPYTLCKVILPARTMTLDVVPTQESDQPMVLLKFIRPMGNIEITVMTEEELRVWKSFFDTAFETALPIVQELDRRAAEALAAGDRTYKRSWRQAPLRHDFELGRSKPHHVQPEDDPGLPGQQDPERGEHGDDPGVPERSDVGAPGDR